MTKDKAMFAKIKPKSKVYTEVRDYVMITIAMLCYSLGWAVFLLPNDITAGGIMGLASILYWATGLSPQVSYAFANFVILAVALKVFGLRFCLKTIYAVTLLTFFSRIMQVYGEEMCLLHDQKFMAAIVGGIFCGSGVGIGLAFNGSAGGTDIIAAIVNKYRDVSLGRVIMLCDIIIITSGYLVFKDWEQVLYGYVTLITTAWCVDQVVLSMRRSVQFFIISNHYQEIAQKINEDAHRGVTVIDGHGFYTQHDLKLLFVLAKKRESTRIFKLINDVDPQAFVSQSEVIGVYGNGFDKFKVRSKRYEE